MLQFMGSQRVRHDRAGTELKIQKQAKCPSAEERMKMWSSHKRNTTRRKGDDMLSFAVRHPSRCFTLVLKPPSPEDTITLRC